MAITSIDSVILKNAFITGARYLESKKRYCNELNVFPVPDGDTGTNMTLTILAAVKEVENADSTDIKAIAKAISSGSLRGARGNSGVILSQLLRGFAKIVSEDEIIDGDVLARAFTKGVETAYKAVMKPKEGTILTVAKEAAAKAVEVSAESDDLLYILEQVIEHAEDTLQKTPDMLPVLKEAGVVDAGGQGLMYVLRGAYMVLEQGGDVDITFEVDENADEIVEMNVQHLDHDIEFGYCTEYIINVDGDMESEREAAGLRMFLETIGDSIVAVADDEVIKIHVHTNDPGLAIQKGLSIGALSNMKIDNMREEHENRVITSEQHNKIAEVDPADYKDFGFVTVSVGTGISEIFNSLGADYVVQGGQTMNPSTDDILMAIGKVPAKHVFVLPNNKNIILAAEQARDLVNDKTVHVIPSKSVPQGITAMIGFDPSMSAEDNTEEMIGLLDDVKTGQITFAIRNTSIDGVEIKEGNLLGILDDKITTVEPDVETCSKALIEKMMDEDSELVTVYYGEEVSKEDAEQFAAYIEEQFDDAEVELHAGNQPLYYYIISVE